MNLIRTGMLMAAMTAIFLTLGYLLGGPVGLAIATVFALGMNFFSYWNSDKVVLRMYGARQVDEAAAPQLYRTVRQLAQNADLPMPKVYVIENPQPNAFATGRNPENAAVAATTGLLKMLTQDEVAAVMAHELAHVKNRDTLTMTITATMAGAIGMVASFAYWFGGSRNNQLGFIGAIAMAILAPMAAALVQMAISRTREFEADRIGAEICGRPLWLASALGKIAGGAARVDNVAAENNPATAHMFIINPLHARKLDGLFSTHPSTDDRIVALQRMAQEMGQAAPRGPWS